MEKIKNKKVILALVLLLGIAATFAYYTTTDSFANIFKTSKYGTKVVEIFESPDNWTPGDETPKTVIVTNTGNICENVRVSYTEKWTSENGNDLPLIDPTLNERVAIINFDNQSDWKQEGNYYYYNKNLFKDESTTSFMKSVTYNPNYSTVGMNCTSTKEGNKTIKECSTGNDSYAGATYKLTITVETVQCDAMKDAWGLEVDDLTDYLMARTDANSYQNYNKIFGKSIDDTNRNKIREIIIEDHKNVPADAIESWDVSEKQNGSILAWYLDSDNNGDYELYIGQDGGVNANPDSSYLFSNIYTGEECWDECDSTVCIVCEPDHGHFNKIDVSKLNTSNVTNMSHMFEGIHLLTSLDLSSFDTSNVIDMSHMFSNMYSINNLNLSSFDTSSVIDMSHMFYGLAEMENLDLSSFDTSKVTNMSYMFHADTHYSSVRTNLSNINLSSFDTRNVTDMKYMFYSLNKITDLNLSNFNTSKVTDMQYMFAEMSNLTNLDVSSFDTKNVTNMKYMFYRLSKITDLNLSHFNTSKVTDMQYMFAEMRNLTNLDVSSFDTKNVTDMKYMFSSVEKIPNLNLSHFETSKVTDMQAMFYYFKTQKLNLTGWNNLKVTNMSWMFYHSYIDELDLSSFNTSSVTSMARMFGYSSIPVLNLRSFDTSNVTNMSYMFEHIKRTTSLDLSNFNTSKVTDMQYMFYDLSYGANPQNVLTTINVSSFDTSKVTNMYYMFAGMNKLTSLDISNFDTSGITIDYGLSHMFEGMSSATNLKLGKKFNTSNATSLNSMFSGMKEIKVLDLSMFETSKVYDMQYMFSGMSNLTTVYVSNKWDTSKISYSNYMFSGCSNLKGGSGTTGHIPSGPTYVATQYIDKTYARIDDPANGKPGYFTYKASN